MTVAATTTCDVCGVTKQEANHWLLVATVDESLDSSAGIAFVPVGSDRFDDDLKRQDICGAACAHQRLSQWLTQLGI